MIMQMGDTLADEELEELDAFDNRVTSVINRCLLSNPEAKNPASIRLYRNLLFKSLTRYAKENLGYQGNNPRARVFDPEYKVNRELHTIDEETAADLEAYENGASAVGEELGADATEIAADAAGIDVSVASAAAEATAASASIPIFNIIVGIISIVVAAAIPFIIATALKKIFH